MTLSSLVKALRLLAVVAHPHDITHMAGTCGHHVERGDSVTAVSVTGGVRVHAEKLYDELRKAAGERNMEIIRESPKAYGERKGQEMREACRLFGITDVRILPFPDNPLQVTEELVRTLAEILYEVRPHILLTHAPYAQVQNGYVRIAQDDHGSTGIAVQRALNIVGAAEYGSQRTPHQVAAIYYTGVESWHDVDLCIDITDQAANRLKAEILFATQAHTAEFARKRLEIGCGAWGWRSRVAYAEPFIRARPQLGRYLMVTEEDLQAVEESREEQSARISQRVSEGRAE